MDNFILDIMIQSPVSTVDSSLFPSNLSRVHKSNSQTFLTGVNEHRQIKFNGSRRFIRGSETNILSESVYHQPKTSVKCNQSAYIDNIKNPNPESESRFLQTKRKALERPKQQIQHPRGYGDFGATKNRLKIVEKRMDFDPITQDKMVHKPSTSNIWQQDRRHRDNGAECKSTLAWVPEKKGSTYLNIYKAKFKN